MTSFTSPALSWLETLLQERLGRRFMLVQQVNTLQLSLPGSDGVITFDQLQNFS